MRNLFGIFFLSVFSCFLLNAGEVEKAVNLLKNPDFSEKNADGLPRDWECRGKTSDMLFAGGGATLTDPAGSKTMLMQHFKKLKSNSSYLFSCELNAPAQTKYYFYFESFVGKRYQNLCGRPSSGNGKWEKILVQIQIPASAEHGRLVIRILTPGTVQIRNLKLKEISGNLSDHGLADLPESVAKEMLYNGNIERGAQRWELVSNSAVIRSNDNLGNGALRVGGRNMPGLAGQSNIRFKSSQEYVLSYFVKGASDTDRQPYQVALKFPGNIIFGEKQLASGGKYQQKKINFITPPAPEGTVYGDLYCRSESGKGIILDEFFIQEITAEDKLSVKISVNVPCNGSRIFSSDPIKTIRGEVKGNAKVAEIAVILKNSSGKVIHRQGIRTNNAEFSIPAENLLEGDYQLIAVPRDKTGKELDETVHVIRKLPPRPNEVVIRSDNNFYLNGKPFFPIFFRENYDAVNTSLASYMAARHGVNGVMHELNTDLLTSLHKNQKTGMKRVISVTWCVNGNAWRLPPEKFAEAWKKGLDKMLTDEILTHPALFGYNVYDEPMGNDIPYQNYRIACQILQEKDPYHPIIYTESPRGVVKEYVDKYASVSDSIGTDLYPVVPEIRHSSLADKNLTAVGRYVKMLSGFAAGKKPVSIWLQAFSWKELLDVPGGRLPRLEENRFMNFDALLHGASMLIYYNDRNFDSEYYNTVLFPSTLEIARAGRVIRFGKDIPRVTADAPLMVMGKIYQNKEYLFVLNRSAAPFSGEVKNIPRNGIWHLIGENRNVDVSNGKLSAEYPPFAVKIYSTATDLPEPLTPLPDRNPQMEAQKHDLFRPLRGHGAVLKNARWIWYPGEENVDDSKITATRDFILKDKIAKAVLYVTADNVCTVFVNHRKVRVNTVWNTIVPLEISSLLVKGKNQLRVEAANTDGMCALLAVLDLTFSNGKTRQIRSDSTWMTENKAGVKKNAIELCPYGKGRWGFRVNVRETLEKLEKDSGIR